jgi:metallophosphoesterase (TIGR00282 family)
MIKILFFGDTVGRLGREAVKKNLSELKARYQPDLIIMNAENLAHGFGATKKIILEMCEAGVDLFTSGNHIWNNEKYEEIFADSDLEKIVLRPFNDIKKPGRGFTIIEKTGIKIFVANLLGTTFMEEAGAKNFLAAADDLMAQAATAEARISLIDFHAEATSEKAVLGLYLDGRASAVVGTHTHVPTADEKILPQGEAFISDVGMTGAYNQAIGGAYEPIVAGMRIGELGKFEVPETGPVEINAVVIEINSETGKAIKIERIRLIIVN